MHELTTRNVSQERYVRALASVWRGRNQLHDPSVWLLKDPDIEEKMLRDADIAHAVGARRNMVAGKTWSLIPSDPDSPRADTAVDVATDIVKNIRRFTEARSNLARAFFSGARFARIHGHTKVARYGDGKPRMWWVPTRLEDLDKRCFRIVPTLSDDGTELSAHWERFDLATTKWEPETKADALHTIRHIYQDDQATLGQGRALREALAWVWYAKTNIFADTLSASGRIARGLITAKVDGARDRNTGMPNEELIRQWVDVLTEIAEESGVMVHDTQDQIEIMQPSGLGWELIEGMRAELKTTLATLILGSNLPTQADSGGSYALAEVQENSTEALVQLDRESLEEALTDRLVACVWCRNYGNLSELGISQEPPTFNLTQEKIQDPTERAGVAEIASRIGLALATDELYEQFGFRRPKDGEPILEVPEPAPALGGFGALPQ